MALGGLTLGKDGNLYGTTYSGGETGNGTVFELIRESNGNWIEKVLHSFAGQTGDGSGPEAGLVFDSHGDLYGTTSGGGEYNWGTAFELVPQSNGNWSEKVLHSFCPSCEDGYFSVAGATLDEEGNLFGTTLDGAGATSYGAVFELSPEQPGTWKETVLHSFNSNDGAYPNGGLVIDSKGNIFGTTNMGGANESGIVFELSLGEDGIWAEKAVHLFGEKAFDGWNPQAGLVSDADGNLYGTTKGGGTGGNGTVFEILDPNRTEAPAFSEVGGTYTSVQTVAITDGTQGASIYFTTNGDDPTSSSKKYAGPIKLDKSEIIKAIAVANGLSNSKIVTENFIIEAPAAAPKFSLKPATYTSIQILSMSDKTADARIFYTADPSTPINAWKLYSGPIYVTSTETVKAYAKSSGYKQSAITSETYTIHLPPAATPVLYPRSGTYKAGQKIVISDKSRGTTIYYTTDGAMPTTSSARYVSAGIAIEHSETIRAIAVGGGHSESQVASAAYMVSGTP